MSADYINAAHIKDGCFPMQRCFSCNKDYYCIYVKAHKDAAGATTYTCCNCRRTRRA